MDDLIVGDVYRINSRNLIVGVFLGYDKEMARFLGIREKFGARYLSEEFGWNPIRIGTLPKGTSLERPFSKTLRRSLGQFDSREGRRLAAERSARWNPDGSPK